MFATPSPARFPLAAPGCSSTTSKPKVSRLDNRGIARVLGEIADLLEIKGDNPFKIRAYRNGADIVANHPHQLEQLNPTELREIAGIGKDLAARIREIAETGACAYHTELAAEFPSSVLDMLHLQGVGPKTVATLYRELHVRTLDDLEQAARSGRVRSIKGMGPKKEELILKALEERKRFAGRHLLAHTSAVATGLVEFLREKAPDATIETVGSLRRGCETCGDIDILATGAPTGLMDAFITYPLAERVLGHGDTKSSVLLKDGYQADLRLVPAESRGAAMQYFTGSKAHNIALRDRAIKRGFKLNEYGLFRSVDEVSAAGRTEEDIYAALDMDYVPPELREDRGEIDRAASHALPRLIERRDLRGDLHMHTTETDGKDSLQAMVDAAADAGLEYIAITDHSQALAMANGLDETRALAHAARVRALDGHRGVRVLAGIECDILSDGMLDLDDDCLAALDIVVASIHSGFNQDRAEMTARVVRAVNNPHVDIIGHLTGRKLLKREASPVDVAAVIDAAGRAGVAMEINSQPHRLDLNDIHATLACDAGVPIVISSDAHSTSALDYTRWGITVARRAGLEKRHVMNTQPFKAFVASLRRNTRR
jgi:DNA polymerase (family 10)